MSAVPYDRVVSRRQRSAGSAGRAVKQRIARWLEQAERAISRCLGGMRADRRAASFRDRAVLRDGTAVCVRAIRPDDKERFRAAFERLSTRSVYQRFFHPVRELAPDALRDLTELDFRDHVGLAMTVDAELGERLIGVGRFVRVASGAPRAELAVTVADEYQHHGAGALLLRQLVGIATSMGVREFIADVLEDNDDMLELVRHSGLPFRQTMEFGVCRVVLSL